MKMIRSLAVLALGLSSLACAPALTMEGARVKVAPDTDIANCQGISSVDALAGSREEAEVLLRNKAGTMNADAVVITEAIENAGQVKLMGKAYSCSAAATGAPQ